MKQEYFITVSQLFDSCSNLVPTTIFDIRSRCTNNVLISCTYENLDPIFLKAPVAFFLVKGFDSVTVWVL